MSKKLDLPAIAKRAGEKLFGDDLLGFEPGVEITIRTETISQRTAEAFESNGLPPFIDEFEFVFQPSTGKGFDCSNHPLDKVFKKHKDKDGFLYTFWAGDSCIYIIGK